MTRGRWVRRFGIMAVVGAACAAGAGAACNTTLDGFSSGEDGGATDAPPGPGPNGGDGASPGEGGGPGPGHDGGADDGNTPPAPDGGSGFCATLSPKPTFCDDFDTDPTFAHWDGKSTQTGGTVTADDAGASSPPYSLRTAYGVTDAGFINAALKKTLGHVTKVTQAFDIKLDSVPSGTFETAGITITSGIKYYLELRVYSNGNLDFVSEHDPVGDAGFYGKTTSLGSPLPLDKWSRITFTIDMSVTPPTATVMVDGLTYLDHADIPSGVTPGPASTLIGVSYAYLPPSAVIAHFDNVVIDVVP